MRRIWKLMKMRRGPENQEIIDMILLLKRSASRNKARIWRALADGLAAPKRRRAAVNLGRLAKVTKDRKSVV